VEIVALIKKNVMKIEFIKYQFIFCVIFYFVFSTKAQTTVNDFSRDDFFIEGKSEVLIGSESPYIAKYKDGELPNGFDYTYDFEISGSSYFTGSGININNDASKPEVNAKFIDDEPIYIDLIISITDVNNNYIEFGYVKNIDVFRFEPQAPEIVESKCGVTTLRVTALPPEGITWYWQGKNNKGKSTSNIAVINLGDGFHRGYWYNATSSGYYYLRAKLDSETDPDEGWSDIVSTTTSITVDQPIAWYEDQDDDGLGDPESIIMSCYEPEEEENNYVSNADDDCPLAWGREEDNGCPLDCYYEDINRITSIAYDFDGTLVSHSKSYFNSVGKLVQTQTLDILTNKSWASNIMYDAFGRPALQTLSAPSSNIGCMLYNPNFFKNSAGNNYTRLDFETNEDNPRKAGTDNNLTANSDEAILGNYYSNLNTVEPYQDITEYPFSRTIYSKLNSGLVKKVVGGNKVKINGTEQWANTYSFTMPMAQELFYVFGKNYFPSRENNAYYIKGKKTIVRDVNGVESVVFSDNEGKVLAAARSGNEDGEKTKYKVISSIGEQGYVDIHIPVGCGGDLVFKGPTTSFTIYNLVTENLITSSATSPYNLSPGFYRIEVNSSEFKNTNRYVTIDSGGNIKLLDNVNNVGVEYYVNYYDFSLNYYDKASRLIKSTQPQGFDATFNLVDNTRNHTLESTFKYNTVGQLLETTSPDEGTAKFKYRRDGQIRFSQNSKQEANNEFSYTNYDALGRPTESGVFTEGSITFSNADSILENILVSGNESADGLPDANCKEQHFTLYDVSDANLASVLATASIPSDNYIQKFVASNVSRTHTENPSTTTTWYSYDIYGRVTWMVQDIEGLGVKTIDYQYDFAQGNVTKVIYQKYVPTELFVHKYNYNSAGQLLDVSISTNNETFEVQESYTYYENGSLKRKELLEGLQGTDYVYNLSGQLKAINHPSLQQSLDPGNDTNDVFGMVIDYHSKDYSRTERQNITTNIFGEDQLNGNIKSIRWNTMPNPLQAPKENAYNYTYNKSNWLQSATFGEHDSSEVDPNIQHHVTLTDEINSGNTLQIEASGSITLKPGFFAREGSNFDANLVENGGFNQINNGDYNVSNLSYDANGNIQTLRRNKNTENSSNKMDDLEYVYKTDKPNQLLRVEDHVTQATNADDIKTQTGDNYVYNNIGQLTENRKEQVKYEYNASGLVTKVWYDNFIKVAFSYNDKGFRTKKTTYVSESTDVEKTTYYVLDASGSTLAIYEDNVLKELPIYGASRLGIYKKPSNASVYQLTDHLGNVRAVIAKVNIDAVAQVATDYYPGGMVMPGRKIVNGEPYRYGYQGEFAETDEVTGKPAFQLRIYDPRINRWLSPDPYGQYHSPYMAMGNDFINGVDRDGGCWDKDGNKCIADELGMAVDANGTVWEMKDGQLHTDYYDDYEFTITAFKSIDSAVDHLLTGIQDMQNQRAWNLQRAHEHYMKTGAMIEDNTFVGAGIGGKFLRSKFLQKASLPVKEIHYMQSSIKNTSKNHDYTVLGNAKKLEEGVINTSLLRINVWKDANGKIWTLDHRRLAAFDLAKKDAIPVRWEYAKNVEKQMWKMSTKTHGQSIRLKIDNGENIIINK
jgi:RHS repeat-associated protein